MELDVLDEKKAGGMTAASQAVRIPHEEEIQRAAAATPARRAHAVAEVAGVEPPTLATACNRERTSSFAYTCLR
jgi:hypothetical protein